MALLVVVVCTVLAYVVYLLIGPQSLSVLLSLEDQRDTLKTDVEDLKEKNAKIQKEYFELKRLQGGQ